MDMVTMHLVLDKIDSSTAQADWDAAAAYYIGSTNGFTTYDRAEKRADGLQHQGVLRRGEHQRGDHHRAEDRLPTTSRD
jgi:hypothetical protein